MKLNRLLLFLSINCLVSLCVCAQQASLEQLKNNIQQAKNQQQKLEATLRLCDQWDSYSPDTLKKYATLLQQLAGEQKNKQAILRSDYYLTLWLYQVNKTDTALSAVDRIYSQYKNSFPYDEMYVKLFGLKANILLRIEKMNDLMQNSFEFMKLAETHNDTLGMARATISIGNVNLRLRKHEESLHWYFQALGLMQNPVYRRKLSFVFNNMAIDYYHLKKQDSALYCVDQGLKYSHEDGNRTNEANALFLYGGMLAEFGHLNEAEEKFKQAVELRKKIGDIYYVINDMSQLALFYANNKEPQKGIALCKEGLQLAENNGSSLANIGDLYEALSRNYEAAGDYKNYGEVLNKIILFKDSMYRVNSAEQMAELQTKYEVQKKENTIIHQRLQLVSKNYQLYGSLALLLLAVIASYIILMQYRKKQRLKLQLVQEEERRKSEKAVADAEEAERKRIAADLHDSLGAYAASITANIDHLRFTQTDSFNVTALHELRNNSMAIVSQLSDTIWALKKDALSLTAISDRIKIFVQRMQSSYPNIIIDVLETIYTDHLLAPSQAFHLFQIMKEAVNNALRHSHCTHLSITISGNKNWRMTIRDNGKGIGDLTITEGGNGLLNMRSRAEESGWKIEWQNNQPKGTQVVIEPTTN